MCILVAPHRKFSTRGILCVQPRSMLRVNDICNTSDITSFCLFADDTSLVLSYRCVDAAVNILNIEAAKISKWLKANKLCLNFLKSNYIIFCQAQCRYIQSVPLVLDGVVLKQVTHTKFLGVEIDENLSWKNHTLPIK